MPDVSVVIPTHRRERLVLEAISSALAQRGVEVEVIVVDDTEEGSARAAVQSIADSRVRYVVRERPSGGSPGVIRNQGAALAQAPLLHFLDDDDLLFEGALEALSRALGPDGAGMAFGRIVPFGDKPAIIEKLSAYYAGIPALSRRVRGPRAFAAQMLFFRWPLVNSACMVRRQAFEEVGGYFGEGAYQDIELFLLIGREYGARFVDQDVLRYRVSSGSMTASTLEPDWSPEIHQEMVKLHRWYRERYGQFEYRALQVASKAVRILGVG